MMMQQMYSNGLNYNLPNMFGSRGGGGGGGGVGGDGGMAMWNQGIKAGPNEAGDSEVEFALQPLTVGKKNHR